MSETKPVILKIGGSVITDKSGELAARTEVINRISEEIAKADVKQLVAVHGGGSFGHPTAQKYGIKEGLSEETQKVGFAETHHVMTVLNGLLMDSLVWHNIPAISLAPSCCVVTENGRIKSFDETILKIYLNMGFTPILYGDATLDEKLGFTILSGDQLVSHLAIKLNASRIVIGVDTDGIYNADPKVDKSARLYTRLNTAELNQLRIGLSKTKSPDVTGGMLGKIAELIPAVERKIQVVVVNASKSNRLYRALKGEMVEGTVIQKE